MHDTAGRAGPARRARCWTGSAASASRFPGVDHAAAGHDRAGLRRGRGEDGRARARWSTPLGTTVKGVTWKPAGAVELPAPHQRHGPRRGRPTDGRRWPATSTWPRRSSRCPAPPTARSPSQGWQELEKRTGVAAGRPGRGAGRGADQLRRHPGPAAGGDHLAGVVGQRDRRPALLAVRGQRRAQEALAHADRPDALLPRPRLDRRVRRGAAGLPAAAELPAALRRPGAAARPAARRSRCAT